MDRKRKMEKVTSIAMVAVIVSALFGAIVIPASAAGEVTVTRSYVQGTESGTAIVTVTYTVNTAIGSIGIKENIPTDWTITEQTSSPATTYRPATHEWICIGPPGVGESGTITYTVSGPAGDAGTISGTYDIGEGPVDTPSTSVTLKNGVGSITVTRTSALGTEAGTAVVTLSYSVNTAIGSIGIKENIPTDWTITEQTSSPATTYRPATHEWICIGPPGVGESGTITYTVSGPVGDTDTISGTYDIGEGPVGTPSTSVTLKGEGPTIVSYTISLQTITPPETTEIDVEFSERVEVWIKIEDVDRNLVNELYHSTGVTDPSPKTWDGTYTDGTVVPAGDYYVNVTGLNTTTGLSVVNNTQTITVEVSTPPVVTSPTATPSTIPADGTTESLLSVTVTDDSEIHSVTIDLHAIGGSATTVMTDMGDNVYSVTTTAAPGTEGIHSLPVNATDIHGYSNTSVSIQLTVGVEPTVTISTDKTSYKYGDTMYVGLKVTNPGAARSVRFALWLELPEDGIYVLYTPTSVTLPAGFDYTKPNFVEIPLPYIPDGTYTWHAALIEPSGPIEPPFISHDTAPWTFSLFGAETPTEDITTVLEQTTVVIDFDE